MRRKNYLVCYTVPDGRGGWDSGHSDVSVLGGWRVGSSDSISKDLADDIRKNLGREHVTAERVSIVSVMEIGN